MKRSDWITILTAVAALSSAISEPLLDTITKGHGAYAAAILATAGIVASVIIRTLTNKTDAPTKAIVSDAATVPAGTTVVTPSTPRTDLFVRKDPVAVGTEPPNEQKGSTTTAEGTLNI